jgi:XTP/dITP diphosphohydrolase
MKLCFATNNINKLREIQDLLGEAFELVTLQEIGCIDEIPEPFDTISENSEAKARFVWENFGIDCFADDSGLEVTALNNEPGVHSAYYAGPQRNSDDNIHLLLQKVGDLTNRHAKFVTVITLILNGAVRQFSGAIEGYITDTKRGEGGFGYDPVFIPEGHDRTFAEMTRQEKSKLSHRAQAFAKLDKFLEEL